MSHIHVPDRVPIRSLDRSGSATMLFGAMFVIGLGAFVVRVGQDAHAAWISYVGNWLFFLSIAAGAVLLAVVTTITRAKWNWSVRRVSASFAAFLPIAFLFALPMLFGLRENYFPWIEEMAHDPILQEKQAWLNVPFLVTRQVAGMLVLFGLFCYFAYLQIRPDLGRVAEAGDSDAVRVRWRERLTAGWKGQQAEEDRSFRRTARLGPLLVLVYAAVMSTIVYDWAMSLEPHWYSTLFGAWFFMSAFWGGVAATAVSMTWLRGRHEDFADAMGPQQAHDLGKLAFAFCVFWGYLSFAQYLVIWYGKLPWEQAWIVHRTDAPWLGFSMTVVALCFVVPFAGLLGRKAKLNTKTLAGFCSVILLGLWLQGYWLIAPSLWHEGDPVFTIWQPLIGLMFLGPFLMSLRWAWTTFPVLQVWQPAPEPEMVEAERAAPSAAGAD